MIRTLITGRKKRVNLVLQRKSELNAEERAGRAERLKNAQAVGRFEQTSREERHHDTQEEKAIDKR